MIFIDGIVQALKSTVVWLFLNALGIAVYFSIEHWLLGPLWNNSVLGEGDPVRDWLGISLPLFAFYFGINMTWLLMSRKNGVLGIGRLSIWLLVCLAWIVVLARDPINLRGFLEMLNGTAWP